MVKNIIAGRLESGKKLKDNEWHCVCCNRVLKSGFVNRHKNSEGHRHNEWLYRYDNFENQI